MKMVKSLLLGAAAGVVGVAGAQAADLPVKAKPVQYVKICSLYGAGFYYMPGTDTCIKVGGFVRAEMNFNANTSYAMVNRANFDNQTYSFRNTRARGAITIDTRSQTEYGTLRSYMVIAEQIDTGTPTTNPQSLGGSDVRTWSNAFFIQFAGFTAGATASFFDFDLQSYSNQTNVVGSNAAGAGIPVFAYTAQLGNGLSASISAEAGEGRRSKVWNATAASTAGYGGREWPDVVANLRIDQAWGSAQVMGALHQVNATTYDGTGLTSGTPGDQFGWAIGGGLRINLPMLGKSDYVIAQAAYSKGAVAYAASGLPGIGGAGAIPAFLIQNGTGAAGDPIMSAVGPAYDATFGAAGTDLDLTTAWSVTGGFEHFWNSQWKTSLFGSYLEIHYSDTSSARLAAGGAAAGGVAGEAGSANWSLWTVGSRTVWTPVQNLDLSVEVMYQGLNTAFTGPTLEDKNWLSGMFRVQRNFYP